MSETKKKTAAPKPVSKKPYLTGTPLDSSCIGGAMRFFLYLLMMAIAFLFLGAVLSFDSFTLRLIINLAVVLLLLTVMFQSGAAAGSVAVNAGELAYQRKESNRMLNDAEIRACYHPLKGFLTALIGSLPLLIAATVLACTTQRQMTSIGALPTWVSSMMDNVDNGAALAVYAQDGGVAGMTILRIVIRTCILPAVNIVGATNSDAMLRLEQFSPLLCCLPMIAYGLGYPQGVRIRTQVQTDIAAGKRKARKKANKERKQRTSQNGPEQLN